MQKQETAYGRSRFNLWKFAGFGGIVSGIGFSIVVCFFCI